MKDRHDHLYVFVHIPKTAGSTFRYHIKKNLKQEQRLLIGRKVLGLVKDREKLTHRDYKVATKNYISKLSEAQKSKVLIIYGHSACYGIHKYFKRPTRYFTFFREPVARTISVYNHKVTVCLNELKHGDVQDDSIKTLLINGKIPSFEDWLQQKYVPHGSNGFNTMTGFLRRLGFVDRNINNINTLNNMFKKFYFVGITSSYSNESLFLYNKLGFKKYYIRQNVSKKIFKIKDDQKIKREILVKNRTDILLYRNAKKWNREFKKRNSKYDKVVRRKKIEKVLLMPFMQSIEFSKQIVKKIVKYH